MSSSMLLIFNIFIIIIKYKTTCTWSCKVYYTGRTSILYLPKERSNLMSKTPKFLPVTERLTLVYKEIGVTGRKVHRPDINFDVVPPVQI